MKKDNYLGHKYAPVVCKEVVIKSLLREHYHENLVNNATKVAPLPFALALETRKQQQMVRALPGVFKLLAFHLFIPHYVMFFFCYVYIFNSYNTYIYLIIPQGGL